MISLITTLKVRDINNMVLPNSSGFPNQIPSYPFSPSGEYPAPVSAPTKYTKTGKFELTGKEINDEKSCAMLFFGFHGRQSVI